MKEESEILLKRAYWQGAFDALRSSKKSDSDKEKATAAVWIMAMDWVLDKHKESDDKIQANEVKP